MRREERNSNILRIEARREKRCVTCDHGGSERKKGTKKSCEEVGLKKGQNETKDIEAFPSFCVLGFYIWAEAESVSERSVWPTHSCSLRQLTNPTPRAFNFQNIFN